MGFEIATVVNGPVVEITMSGVLDASTASQFERELEGAATVKPSRLVLRVGDLVFFGSIGVRLLLRFQKKVPGVDVHVIAPTQGVLDTLERTAYGFGVIVQDEYSDAE